MMSPDIDQSEAEVSGVEGALLGSHTRQEIDAWVERALDQLLGTSVAAVRFRSGRIDAVYGLDTTDGGQVLMKVHRPPVHLEARRLVARAQQQLAQAGFPCARPLAGPTEVDGHVVSVETLLPEGERADGHDPRIRGTVARTLAEQVGLLENDQDLVHSIRQPPAWCDYRGGAWSSSHDEIFDFSTTPAQYAWLQHYAQEAADEIMATNDTSHLVAAHADWYCGNLRFDGTRLSSAFDWDLFADSEVVVAGITAGMYSAGTSNISGPPTPEDAAGFLADYEAARVIRFTDEQRTTASAAVRWSIAYTARCDVFTYSDREPPADSALHLLATRRDEYRDLSW